MKKTTGWLLAVLLLLCVLAGMASAENQSGTVSGGGTWTLEDGILTFSGTADLSYWEMEDDFDFMQEVTEVHFGPDVVHIPADKFGYSYNLTAFVVDSANSRYRSVDGVLYSKNMSDLIAAPTGKNGSLTVPDGVKCICDSAFLGSYLEELILPDSLETLERQAFWNARFTSLHIPANVVNLEPNALNVSDVVAFTVSDSNPAFSAEDGVLYSKDGTTLVHYPPAKEDEEFTVPGGVEKIGSYAFSFANNLCHLKLQEGVTMIASDAFNWCTVEVIELPASLEEIESGAFGEANHLTEAVYAGTVSQLADVLVRSGNDYLTGLTIQCSDGEGEITETGGDYEAGISFWKPYETFYVVSGVPLGWTDEGLFMDDGIANIWLDIPEELADELWEQEPGGPAWSIERQSGTAKATINYPDYSRYRATNFWGQVTLTKLPTQAEEDEWTVHFWWGDYHWETSISQKFKKTSSKPTGVNKVVSKWELEVGDKLYPAGHFEFEDNWCLPGEEISWGFSPSKELWEALDENDIAIIPGKYSCVETVCCANLCWPNSTYLYIVAAKPQIRASNLLKDVYILPLELSETTPYSDALIGGFMITNEEKFADQTSDPTWKVEAVSGTLRCRIVPCDQGRAADLVLTSMPTKAETMKVKVTCTWAKQSTSKTITVNFKKLSSRPAGLDTPIEDGRWTVMAGEGVPMSELFTFADGWTIPGETAEISADFVDCDADVFWDYFETRRMEDDTWQSFIYEPGIYRVVVAVRQQNTYWPVAFELVVLNEDGSMPSTYYSAFRSSASKVVKLPENLEIIEEDAFVGIAAQRVEIPETCAYIRSGAFAGISGLRELRIPGNPTNWENAFDDLEGVILVTTDSTAQEVKEIAGTLGMIIAAE